MKHINFNFIFWLDKMAGELDNVTQPQRPSKEQSKYDNRGESTPNYNRKKVKMSTLDHIYSVLGGIK